MLKTDDHTNRLILPNLKPLQGAISWTKSHNFNTSGLVLETCAHICFARSQFVIIANRRKPMFVYWAENAGPKVF